MQVNQNILSSLHYEDYRLGDWLQVLSTVLSFSKAKCLTEVEFYTNQKADETQYDIKLCFTSNKGKLEKALVGPALTKELFGELQTTFERLKPQNRSDKVARYILFSMFPVESAWQNDQVAILPVPESAPRPSIPYTGHHPFIFELKTKLTEDSSLNFELIDYQKRHWTDFLNVILEGDIYRLGRTIRQSWCMVDNRPNEPKFFTQLCQKGYSLDDWNAIQDDFSKVEDFLPEMEVLKLKDYYRNGYVHDGFTLRLPENIDTLISKYNSLSEEAFTQFQRAAHYFSQADAIVETTPSLAFVSLVSAIEVFLPEPSNDNCSECGQRKPEGSISHFFKEFLERFAPGLDKKTKNKIYGMRSDIVHNGKLLTFEYESFASIMTPRWRKDRKTFDLLRHVVQVALINWLCSD